MTRRANIGSTGSGNCPFPSNGRKRSIRAAITLKLCSVDDTGAVVAALTTSIREAPGSGRNWDYRYCWLRDAYFTVHALNRLSATRTTERFIDYVTNVVAMERGSRLRPVYAIVPDQRIDERVIEGLQGFNGQGPVRVGNAAVDQIQHDVYGSVILAASLMFFDERLPGKGTSRSTLCWNRWGRGHLTKPCNRTRASGSIAAGRASIPIRRRCVGPAATGFPPSLAGSGLRWVPPNGALRPTSPRDHPVPAWNADQGAFGKPRR